MEKNISLGKKIILVSIIWLFVAVLTSSLTFLSEVQGAFVFPFPFYVAIIYEVICITPWAICTPLVAKIARTYSFGENRIYISLLAHTLTALLVFGLHSLVQSAAVSVFFGDPFTLQYLMDDFWGFLDMRLLLYLGLLLAVYSYDFYWKSREIKLRASELKAQINQAKYDSLLNQIQPDFLLSSLDSIENNISRNILDAENVISDLSDVLRQMLKSINQEHITVEEHYKSLRRYLNLVESRKAIKINSESHINEDCLKARITPFFPLLPALERIFNHHFKNKMYVSYSVNCESLRTHLKLSISRVSSIDERNGKILDGDSAGTIFKELEVKSTENSTFKITASDDSIVIDVITNAENYLGSEVLVS